MNRYIISKENKYTILIIFTYMKNDNDEIWIGTIKRIIIIKGSKTSIDKPKNQKILIIIWM